MTDRIPQPPIADYRAGGLQVAIWRSEVVDRYGTPRIRHSVRINKSYFDEPNNVWRDTDYLFDNDLPRLRLLLDKAFEFIVLNKPEPDAIETSDVTSTEPPQAA
jgi:hypothetical protein